jgi:hypothetical protein
MNTQLSLNGFEKILKTSLPFKDSENFSSIINTEDVSENFVNYFSSNHLLKITLNFRKSKGSIKPTTIPKLNTF